MQCEAGAAGALHGALQKGALGDDVHRVAGPAADDPQHVQDRRRADAGGDPRRRAHGRDPRALDLRRPQRRHARRARRAGRCSPPARSRRRTTSRWSRTPRRCGPGSRSSTSSTASARRHEINKIALLERRRPAGAGPRRRRPCLPRPRPDARRAGRARHGPEPGRVLPGPRGRPTLPPRRARHRRRRSWTSSRRGPGRRYGLVDYHGAPDAERVIVVMGSARRRGRGDGRRAGRGGRAGRACSASGCSSRSRPSSSSPRCRRPSERIAVLDRTKEPGAVGEPLYLEVVAALDGSDGRATTPPFATAPRVIGGRYGLSSKEFTPAMVKPVFDELAAPRPKRHFTVGIYDDVTHLSLPIDADVPYPRPAGEVQALFFGLGSDGTVGANKASVKIIGESTDLYAQGYFVYDSKKSGSVTVSHLRFGPEPIRSTYLVEDADFVACHQFGLLEQDARPRPRPAGSDRSCSTPRTAPTRSGTTCPRRPAPDHRQGASTCGSIDAARRRARGRHGQPHQHGHAAVLLPARRASCRASEAIARDQGARARRPTPSAARRSSQRNFAAIDRSLERLRARAARWRRPSAPTRRRRRCPPTCPDFVHARHRPAHRRRGRPAAGERAPGRRHVPDRHGASTRSGRSPRRSRSGIRRSASTAASARWSARTRRSG